MGETKLSGPDMATRVAKRLRNSGEGANPTVHTQTGNGPTRVHHNLHQPSGQAHDGGGGKEIPKGRDILRDFGGESK